MPLKRVVLFNSGVGFFEHDGQVTDDAQVDMKFKTDDINDLLKSMVVQDLGGGQVSTISYGSKDPISKTLKSFAIDLTTNPTLGQLLGQIRGEQVAIEAPNAITGTILGVETRDQKVGDNQVQKVEYLDLLTDAGLRSVALDKVSAIKLVNEKLNSELRGALALLASSHDMDKKTVTINFVGQGKREVRLGYIQETPIWKTSYRLVLDDEKAPFLQGWAIVENTTEEDWNGVGLSLVSGRPISFVMDLYQPLYIPRPVEELELYASLRPQTYDQDLARKDKEFRKLAQAGKSESKALADGMALVREQAAMAAPPMKRAKAAEAKWNLQQGAQSVAKAQDVGEAFQYAIATPVSLPRQQSAMLQIVNADVKGEKVSIYNPSVHPKHPLAGLKLTNSTELHLMQGPITVFDDGVYAGDAKIQDLPPKSERLISYAMDLNTEVAPQSKGRPEQLLSVRPGPGVHGEKLRAQAEEGAHRAAVRLAVDAGLPQGACGKDSRPVPLRGGGQAGRAGHAAGGRGADRRAADRAVEHRRRHGPHLPQRQGCQRRGQGRLETGDRAEDRPGGHPGQEAATGGADPGHRAGAEPHPAEHGPARPHGRSLQALRPEVHRAGEPQRQAPWAD